MKIFKIIIILLIPFLFLIIGLATIRDYGINWDEPFHFARGQALLHYLLTGKENYLDIPAYSPKPKGDSDFMDQYGQEPDYYLNAPKSSINPSSKIRRSYYQSDVWTYDYITKQQDVGHPESSDILAAFSNYLFYQKLGILGDLESYHLFEVLTSFFLVLGLAVFIYQEVGLTASFFAAASLASYPLFFAESHFNIKDPVSTVFFGLTIMFFYSGVTQKKWWKIIFSSIFFALSLGTKFNAFFIVPILGIWFLFYLFSSGKKKAIPIFKNYWKEKKTLVAFLFYPLLTIFLLYLFTPSAWHNPIVSFTHIFNYYKEIGIGTPPELAHYLIKGFNFFPSVWFLLTIQIPYLILFLIGLIIAFWRLLKNKNHFYLLILLWFFIPFIRVTVPDTNIYGGIRQILEFLPAMAILIGEGAVFLITRLKFRRIMAFLVMVGVIFSIFEIIRLHPNENVYFNQLIGGLSGAQKANIPYWGNSYGNVYLQGVEWLNQNVPQNSKLALPINSPYFIPRTKLRSDIDFSDAYLSGPEHKGEYVMEQYFDWSPENWYRYAYYDTFLQPVYEIKVQGTTIFKIWKNSPEFVRPGFDKEVLIPIQSIKLESKTVTPNVQYKQMLLDLGKEVFLTEIKINHQKISCDRQLPGHGYFSLSEDGINWKREPEEIFSPQSAFKTNQFNEMTFTFLFAAKKARYIFFDTQMTNPCLLKDPEVKITALKLLS